jgi:GNAT superfamily N-acetyltransferase
VNTIADGYTDVPAGRIAAVVTWLDMRAPASPRPEVDGTGWELRRHERPDLAWYRDLFRRVGEDWLWFSRLTIADADLAAILHDPRVEVYALWQDGRAEGLLELDFREADACQLAFFGVTPHLIGTGAGRWLMNRALARAWAQPIQRFWVHTCTLDHPGAVEFYLRSGFTAIRRQIEVASDPRLQGNVALTAAPHAPIIR